MEPETPTQTQQLSPGEEPGQAPAAAETGHAPESFASFSDADDANQFRWIFWGEQGLRAGWSVLIFIVLFAVCMYGFGTVGSYFVRHVLHAKVGHATATSTVFGEGMAVLSLLAAGMLVALIERRRVWDYNLGGPRRWLHFASGLIAGFAALSALVGSMAQGGWLHFGPVALSGGQILKFAAMWGLGFLLVGLMEEGSFRCYLQFTLARGINFWWAVSIIGAACLNLALRPQVQGMWGVYMFALLGLFPCLWLQLRKTAGNGFWQAAWATSTLFGFIHTGNNGENWIGIFAAAAIGFVFCVSVRLTGSAWWAIGCHASWDWAETYFYGTADSGLVAQGHYMSTSPTGSALWSGGTNGPEGSLLVLPIIFLLLLAVLALYGRKKPSALTSVA